MRSFSCSFQIRISKRPPRPPSAVEDLTVPHAARVPPGVLTISFGVASVCLDDPQNIGQLLKDADAALYRAKGQGRNRVAMARSKQGLRVVTGAGGSDASAAS